MLQSDYYASMAEQNRVKEVPILAPRGKLLDREGRPIVENYPSFSALLLRSQGKISDSNLDAIAAGLHMDADELKTQGEAALGHARLPADLHQIRHHPG